MDFLVGLTNGFAILLTPSVLAAGIVGLIAGMVGGFLPCLSPAGALALAGAFVGVVGVGLGFQSPAVFLIAVAYGTLYGRTLAALNLHVGESAPAAAAQPKFDLSGPIRGLIAAIVVAAGIGAVVVILGSRFSLQLGPVEFAALVVFLLLTGAAFGRGSTASALAMAVLGLLLGIVGTDIETGVPRLTFGLPALENGLNLLSVAIGLFVIANVIDELARAGTDRQRAAAPADRPARGFLVNAVLAVLAGFAPTNGAMVATTTLARRTQPDADMFDPASQKTVPAIIGAALMSDMRLSVSLIPLLLWFLPVDAIGAFLRGGIAAQAALTHTIADRGALVWLVCATLIVLHVVPLVIMTGADRWRPIRLDVRIVAPLIVACCCVPALMSDQSLTGFAIMFVFGLIGYVMICADFDRSLLFFAFAVGHFWEENVRRTMLIARGDVTVFIERPISAVFLLAGIVILVAIRMRRHRRFQSSRSETPA